METRQPDAVVTEVRAVRVEHAARSGYDVRAMVRAIRSQSEASGRKFVCYPARTIDPGSTDARR